MVLIKMIKYKEKAMLCLILKYIQGKKVTTKTLID